MLFTADWHFGDERLEILGRPFKSPEENFETIRDNINSVADKNEVIIVNGDVLSKHADVDKWLPRVSEINPRKILIRGNHDAHISDEQFLKYFDEVVPEGGGITMDIEGIECYITHYPTQGVADKFNLVGHIHSAFKYQLNCLNVGVDVHHFRPVPKKKIKFHFDAICNFYDEDVWVGYSPINTTWKGLRGKPGTYFKKDK